MTDQMGAIRVRVQLTNAFDKRLVDRGSLAPRHLREYNGEGLVDTGALTLVIPPAIADNLDCRLKGVTRIAIAKEC